jgi:predicted nucleic acid-binding protein
LVARAEARYVLHPDKTWSLTDCLSMEVMLDHGSTEVAGADHHFMQAGFRILLASDKVQ